MRTLPAQCILHRNVIIKYRDSYLSLDAAAKAQQERPFMSCSRMRMNPSELPAIIAWRPYPNDFRLTIGCEVTDLASSPRAFERLRTAVPSSAIHVLQMPLTCLKRRVVTSINPPASPSTHSRFRGDWNSGGKYPLPPIFNYPLPSNENTPQFDLPFTSFVPESFTRLGKLRRRLLPLLRFFGPELLSLTLPNVY